jgi:hypothetical protein
VQAGLYVVPDILTLQEKEYWQTLKLFITTLKSILSLDVKPKSIEDIF